MAIIILIIVEICSISQAEEIPQIVFINGVENGICLVPNVNLWNKPGGIFTGAKVKSIVRGCVGLPVKIIETRYIGSKLWYHVKTFGVNIGKSGWLTDSLIKH